MMQRNLTSVMAEKRMVSNGNISRASSNMDNPRLKKLADSIERFNDDDHEKNIIENLRLFIKSLLIHSYIGMIYRNFMLLLNILTCFEYIYSTYLHYSKPRQKVILNILEMIEFYGGIIFSFDWFFHLFLADHRRLYLISMNSIIDILTVVPIFTTYNVVCSDYAENTLDYSSHQIVNFILCALQTVRILRALRVRERFEVIDDEVQRFLANIISTVITLILFNSAIMNFLEYSQNYAFHTWIYYTTVTIATVGYGDVTPKTDIGRVAAMAFIITAIIYVPRMTNELIEMMNMQSIYARIHYVPKSNSQHVLICGHLSSSALQEFFEELFHEDHEIRGLHCVILQPFTPNYEMLQILHNPNFQLSLTYLEGSPLSDKDLQRAFAHTARAIFIMTNKFSSNPDEEDAKTILQQFSIQKFIRLYSNHSFHQPYFCIQLIRPENKRHLVSLERNSLHEKLRLETLMNNNNSNNNNGNNSNGNMNNGQSSSGSYHHIRVEKDLVICLNEIKMGVIAKAVIFPGANTLIMNLLTSFSDEVAPSTNSNIKPIEGIETLEEDEHNSDWIGEYQRGCDWEIYTTELSSSFEGTAFVALSEILYQKLGVILFGLEIEELRKEKSQPVLLLNPADFMIPSNNDYRILGFVIAKNKAQSDLTFNKLANQDPIFTSGVSFSQLSLLTNAMSLVSSASNSNLLHAQSALQQQNNNNKGSEGSTVSDEESGSFNPPLQIKGSAKDFYQASLKKLNSPHNKNKGKPRGRNTMFRIQQPWQWLLKRYEQKKTTETIQEEMQRLEDHLLREHYFIRESNSNSGTSFELNDAYIKTSIMEEMPFIEGHIIIIGKALSNLYDLIRPLRAKSLGILKPIVILYPRDFPLRVWQRIGIFESIWIVRGSGLEDADIRRCGIFKAKQVVLLANASATTNQALAHHASTSASSVSLNALDDADAIFCYQAVRRMNETCHIVVEIVRHTNVSYLDPETGLNSTEVDYKFTPQFAAGSLFATSLLDTLVCQAFYNTKIIEILNLLVGGIEKREIEKATNQYYKNNTGATSKAMKGLIGSSLYQIPLPDGLVSRTYGALYSLLAKRKQIPLGILRGVFSTTKSGPKANVMPYVFTNPPKDTELFSCDKIFVLSQTPIKITRVAKDDSKEVHLYSTIRTKKKTAEDVLNVVNTLYDDIREQQIIHEKMEEKMYSFDSQLAGQFQGLFQQMKNVQEHLNQMAMMHTHNTPQRTRATSRDRESNRDSIYSIHSSMPTARSFSSARTTRFTLNRPTSGDEYHRNSSPSMRFSLARKRTYSDGAYVASSPSMRASMVGRKSLAGSNNNNNNNRAASTPPSRPSQVQRKVGMTPSPNSSPSKIMRKRLDKS